MPNYEFKCQSCQKQFQKSMPFGSKELPTCPVCLGATKRIITPPMVHFKGSGFYKTDAAGKITKESAEAPPAKEIKAPEPKPVEKKPESKPQ